MKDRTFYYEERKKKSHGVTLQVDIEGSHLPPFLRDRTMSIYPLEQIGKMPVMHPLLFDNQHPFRRSKDGNQPSKGKVMACKLVYFLEHYEIQW